MAAATVEISETNGLIGAPQISDSSTGNPITNINFGGVDAPNLDPTTHPVVLSTLNPTYSFTKWMRLYVSNMGTSASISLIKVWKSAGVYEASSVIGSTSSVDGNASIIIPSASYGHCIASLGGGPIADVPYQGDGTEIIGNWGTYPMKIAQPASENMTIGGALGGSLSAHGYSDYTCFALKGDGSAGSPTPPGNVATKTFTFQYNES